MRRAKRSKRRRHRWRRWCNGPASCSTSCLRRRRVCPGVWVMFCGVANYDNWLVVWNMNFIFPYVGNSNPNWLSYFSEGFKPPTRQIMTSWKRMGWELGIRRNLLKCCWNWDDWSGKSREDCGVDRIALQCISSSLTTLWRANQQDRLPSSNLT